jgi:hypothetical protein
MECLDLLVGASIHCMGVAGSIALLCAALQLTLVFGAVEMTQ